MDRDTKHFAIVAAIVGILLTLTMLYYANKSDKLVDDYAKGTLTSIHRYRRTYDVTVICPKCGLKRQETWKLRPDMKEPRVACKSCKGIFQTEESGEDTRGLSVRCNSAQRQRRAAN